jgi:hypothetical protein
VKTMVALPYPFLKPFECGCSEFHRRVVVRAGRRNLPRFPRRESSLECKEKRDRRDAHDCSEPAQRANEVPGPVFAHDLVVVRDVHNQGEQRRAQAADDAWKRVTSLFRENL